MNRNRIGKFFGLLFLACVGVLIAAPAPEAEAQVVVYGAYCCDAGGIRRCVINYTPIGNPCFCYNQGAGWACG
jgi:hypothetical protein